MYGCESWTTCRCHIRSLDQFHMRCLCHIARIKWPDKIPNTEVLSRCKISGIEAFIIGSQLWWVGHIRRMPDIGIPKATFYAELQSSSRPRDHPLLHYRDNLKANMKSTDVDPEKSGRTSPATDRSGDQPASPMCSILRLPSRQRNRIV